MTVRWQCFRCGRFVPESAVHSEDRIDPGAYYGVTSRIWADCARCGEVDAPRPVVVGESVGVVTRPAECHPDRQHEGRGLCRACVRRARRAGTLADHPRMTRSRAEFLAEYELLHGQGYPNREIASRLGVTVGAVLTAVRRARRAGERVS